MDNDRRDNRAQPVQWATFTNAVTVHVLVCVFVLSVWPISVLSGWGYEWDMNDYFISSFFFISYVIPLGSTDQDAK